MTGLHPTSAWPLPSSGAASVPNPVEVASALG